MRRVLVIDDEDIITDMLKDVLESKGYEVIVANSGREGLARALDFKPNLIVLDINMPGMSGFEVLSNLKKNAETRNIPVIISTINDSKLEIDRGYSLGAKKFLVKPYSANFLQKTLELAVA